MKRLPRTAVLAVSAALVSQAAYADSFVKDDLYLGFNQSSASSDYIVDLGQPGDIGVGGATVMDLSSLLSMGTFVSVFTGGPSGVSAGVVGGSPTFGSYDIYVTQERLGGAGDPAAAGSPDLSGNSHSSASLSYAAGRISSMQPNLPSAGADLADSTKSFTSDIAPTLSAQTFYGATGIDPLTTMDSSGAVYEDLWHATEASPYTYLGYFKLDMSGSNPSLTFTPSATVVPEPATWGIFGLAGLVGLFFRHPFKRKQV